MLNIFINFFFFYLFTLAFLFWYLFSYDDDDDDDFCMLIFFGLQVKATIIIPVTTEKIQITLVSYQEPIILGF